MVSKYIQKLIDSNQIEIIDAHNGRDLFEFFKEINYKLRIAQNEGSAQIKDSDIYLGQIEMDTEVEIEASSLIALVGKLANKLSNRVLIIEGTTYQPQLFTINA